MMEIFGKSYSWTREQLKEQVTDRLLKGAELTINERDKEAWINKWLKNPQQINIELARLLVNIGLVGSDSGNIETGDTHYTFKMR